MKLWAPFGPVSLGFPVPQDIYLIGSSWKHQKDCSFLKVSFNIFSECRGEVITTQSHSLFFL